MKRYSRLRIAAMIAGALFMCAQISAELTVRGCRRAAESDPAGPRRSRTVLSLFIGQLEELVGDVLLLKADNYFHGQTSLLGELRLSESSHAGEHSGCTHGSGHEGLSYDHFLYRQYLKVAPTSHAHVEHMEEIVPWLYAGVRLNGGDERTAVLVAYWLGRQLDKPEEAERVLRTALAAQPSSWRLRGEIAWLQYRAGRVDLALRQCENAIRRFEPAGDEAQARLDLAKLWRLASVCQERRGDLARAVACAQVVTSIMPENEAAVKRLDDLKAQLGPGPWSAGDPSVLPVMER